MLVSRWTQRLSTEFKNIAAKVRLNIYQMRAGDSDIATSVESRMQDFGIAGEAGVKQRLATRIQNLADGNFLWIDLVLEELFDCHTEEGMNRFLELLPPGLERTFERMAKSLMSNWNALDEQLAMATFKWATCSKSPLNIQQMSGALGPQGEDLLDREGSIRRACGNFIEVDGACRITLVHHTAREYLTAGRSLSIHPSDSHKELLLRCLSCLQAQNLGAEKRG
jgi:hypothetical protein